MGIDFFISDNFIFLIIVFNIFFLLNFKMEYLVIYLFVREDIKYWLLLINWC